MAVEKGPHSSPKPSEGEGNFVPLTSVLEIINSSPLVSVQKTALTEALEKALGAERIEHPLDPAQTVTPPDSIPIETQQTPSGKENKSDLLGKLEEVFKIRTNPNNPDSEEDRVKRVIQTAENHRQLATDLVRLAGDFKESGPGDLEEAVEEKEEEKSGQNPDPELLELIVRRVLESVGINFYDLNPLEQRTIVWDLERQGIDMPEDD